MEERKIKHFTDLEVWREAHKLTLLVYKVVKQFPPKEIYGLTSQIKRAAISIESCIAEGFYRYHYKDRLNFYYDSRGSIGELQSQLIDSKDLGFCKQSDFARIWEQSEKVRVMLQGLINSTSKLSRK